MPKRSHGDVTAGGALRWAGLNQTIQPPREALQEIER
jgi:hypothetical protein